MYTSQAAIQGYLGRDLSEAEATIVAKVIAAAETFINIATDTSWEAPADAATTKLYNGGEEFIFIDPATEVTLVERLNMDGTVNFAYDTADWLAYPLNATPKTRIRLHNGVRRWPHGQGVIRVTAKWGEGAGVPEDISYAAMVLVSRWLLSEPKNLLREEIEGYTRFFAPLAEHDPEVAAILGARTRVRL